MVVPDAYSEHIASLRRKWNEEHGYSHLNDPYPALTAMNNALISVKLDGEDVAQEILDELEKSGWMLAAVWSDSND